MISNTQFKNLAKRFGTPLYVYDVSVIEKQWKALQSAIRYEPHRIYYAAKANSNLHILKLIKELGAYLDVASPVEIYLGLKAGFKTNQMSFTGLNLSEEEIVYVIKHNVIFNADSLSQLEKFGKLIKRKKAESSTNSSTEALAKVGIRINPVFGAGHHKKVITAGLHSKFGIYFKDINKIKIIIKKYNLKVVGMHQHIGSGILKTEDFLRAIEIILDVAKKFDDLGYIDFGGGFGIPYRNKAGERALNIKHLGLELSEKFKKFAKEYGKDLELRIEPGRFLVAQSGTLLTEVTAIKKNPAGDIVVGTNSGMTHMLRHALYGSFHEIENISNSKGKGQKATIVGNICESSDVFAKNRILPLVREGDILALRDTGAYGFSMASRFNGKFLPAEVLVYPRREHKSSQGGSGQAKLIRHRDKFEDFLPS